jgi:hypothetical protein
MFASDRDQDSQATGVDERNVREVDDDIATAVRSARRDAFISTDGLSVREGRAVRCVRTREQIPEPSLLPSSPFGRASLDDFSIALDDRCAPTTVESAPRVPERDRHQDPTRRHPSGSNRP